MLTLILTTLMSAATAAPSPSRLASGSHGAADDLNTSAVIPLQHMMHKQARRRGIPHNKSYQITFDGRGKKSHNPTKWRDSSIRHEKSPTNDATSGQPHDKQLISAQTAAPASKCARTANRRPRVTIPTNITTKLTPTRESERPITPEACTKTKHREQQQQQELQQENGTRVIERARRRGIPHDKSYQIMFEGEESSPTIPQNDARPEISKHSDDTNTHNHRR